MNGTRNAVADIGTDRSGRVPAAIVLSTEEALDLLAAAEEAVAALDHGAPKAIAVELTNATSALIAALFRDFPAGVE